MIENFCVIFFKLAPKMCSTPASVLLPALLDPPAAPGDAATVVSAASSSSSSQVTTGSSGDGWVGGGFTALPPGPVSRPSFGDAAADGTRFHAARL